MATKTAEFKAAEKMVTLIGHCDFQHDYFAACLTQAGSAIQKRLFRIFLSCAHIWAEWYDEGLVTEDSPMFTLCVYAKRITSVIPQDHVRLDED